jgi:hypothetical protein
MVSSQQHEMDFLLSNSVFLILASLGKSTMPTINEGKRLTLLYKISSIDKP